MANSTKASDSRKPHPDYPLTPRGDGRWCKKIKGQFHYFTGTADEALSEWLRVKDDLLAGRLPSQQSDTITVRDVCNKFLAAKKTALDVGTINPRTFVSYKKTTSALVESLGRTRAVTDLRPDDFAKLYRTLTKRHGASTLGREITIVRSVFKYAMDSDMIDRPVKFGPEFKAPSKKDKRKLRNKNKRERGARMFEPDEVRRLLAAAGPQLRAMILLGINGGLGNNDCASLHLTHLDLESGWLDFPRPKTEIDRRIPLWPETVAALREVIANRRTPSDPAFKNNVFVTRLGQPWVRYDVVETKNETGNLEVKVKADDAVSKAMAKLMAGLGIHRRGVNFYALRHTFETIAGASKDQVAVDAIMGHVDSSMAGEYREGIEDDRLLAAVNHVRAWLFPAPAKGKSRSTAKATSGKPAKGQAQKATARASRAVSAEGMQLRIVG